MLNDRPGAKPDPSDRIKSYSMVGGYAMRSTTQMSITLPNEMAASVKARVASGDYASESEVVREGLRTLAARDAAVEKWLQTEVAQAYAEAIEHPELSISSDDMAAELQRFFATRREASVSSVAKN